MLRTCFVPRQRTLPTFITGFSHHDLHQTDHDSNNGAAAVAIPCA